MILLYLLNTILPILALLLMGSLVHVLFHEVGHAIPVLLRSRHSWATVYIGSYGDPARSFGIQVGRLKIWMKYNPFLWFRGMCEPGGASFSVRQQIGYIAGGPVGSVLLCVAGCVLLTFSSVPGFLRLWLGFIVLFSVMGIFGSIVPTGRQRYRHDGTPVYPDLILILRLLQTLR